MGEFNAAIEAQTIDKMAIGFANEQGQYGGGPASERLMDAVNREWCKWQPTQQTQLASSMDELKNTLSTHPAKDGSGEVVGFNYRDYLFLPIQCR